MKKTFIKSPVTKGISASAYGSVSMLALLSSISSAQAQQSTEPDTSDDATVVEEVTVVGIRSSMQKNLEMKRNANSIVDAINAEDIGKFPDKNVADSLQRVPGVVIDRSGGEGSRVSIRGSSPDLTLTQLNGNYIAPPTVGGQDPERSFDYSLMPSALIERVEVFKSSEARLDEGGVGGTVILHSRKPLSLDANHTVIDVEATYADVTEELEPSLTGLYSWKNDAENFGVLVGFSQQNRTNRTLSGMATAGGGYRWIGGGKGVDANGNPTDATRFFDTITDARGNDYNNAWVPQVVETQITEEQRERQGIQLTAQFLPTENIELGANYFRFQLGQDRTDSRLLIPEWGYNPNFTTDVTLDETGNVVTGMDFTAGASGDDRNLAFPWMAGQYVREKAVSESFELNGMFSGDGFELRAAIGVSQAEGGPSEQWGAAYKAGAPASFTASGEDESAAQYAGWSTDGGVSIYMDPAVLDNLRAGIGGQDDPGSSGSSFIVSDQEQRYAQLDLDIEVDFGPIHTIRTGVKRREGDLNRIRSNTFFVSPEAYQQYQDGEIAYNDIPGYSFQNNGNMPDIRDVLNDNGAQNIPGGFDINVMPTINWDRYRSAVVDAVDENGNPRFVQLTRPETNFTFGVQENITAAYIQADYEFDTIGVRGNFGLRAVKTDTTTASTNRTTYFLDYRDDETGELVSGLARNIDDDRLAINDQSHTYYLPSFNIVWDATDDLIIRGAISKTMARPPIVALAGVQSASYTSQEWADDRAAEGTFEEAGWRGEGGNPNLQPYESTAFDLSAEYYFAEQSGIGIALFRKEIDNFVLRLITTSTQNFPGYEDVVPAGEITLNPYIAEANGSNAVSQGVELFFQHAFDNGFGLYANYTFNDTNQADVSLDGESVGQSALVGSVENQVNFSTYYENDLFNVRLSYNRRGERVGNPAQGFNEYDDPYQQLDLNASVNLSDSLTLTGSIINLTEEETFTRLGNDTDARLLSSGYSGRRAYLGLNYQF